MKKARHRGIKRYGGFDPPCKGRRIADADGENIRRVRRLQVSRPFRAIQAFGPVGRLRRIFRQAGRAAGQRSPAKRLLPASGEADHESRLSCNGKRPLQLSFAKIRLLSKTAAAKRHVSVYGRWARAGQKYSACFGRFRGEDASLRISRRPWLTGKSRGRKKRFSGFCALPLLNRKNG